MEKKGSYNRNWHGDPDPFKPGLPCTANRNRDQWCEYDSREFIDAECFIIKRTNRGLIQIALKLNPKKTYSFGQKNITLL